MKRSTLIMLASATVLMATAASDTVPTVQGKDAGQNMGQHKQMKQMKNKKHMRNMRKNRMNSPFLIKHGLPHMTKLIMRYMNDSNFALTAEQKAKLAKVRENTMGSISKIKPEVMELRKSIVNEATSGKASSELKEKVEKLASLEAQATMVHLQCIEETKAILTKDQLLYLLANKNKGMQNKNSMRGGHSKRVKKN